MKLWLLIKRFWLSKEGCPNPNNVSFGGGAIELGDIAKLLASHDALTEQLTRMSCGHVKADWVDVTLSVDNNPPMFPEGFCRSCRAQEEAIESAVRMETGERK